MTPKWIRSKITHRGNKHPPGVIGVEIEVEGRNLPKAIFQNWVIHDDGSLRGEDNAEYVLREPMSRDKVESALEYLEEQFKALGSRLDTESDRTSVHIHLNVQDKTWAEIFTFWTLWTIIEDLSYELCGPERRGNLFCLRVKDCEGLVSSARASLDEGDYPFQANDYRYAGCNVTSVFKFGSLEFRGMHGTVDKKEILLWIDFLLLCLTASGRFHNPHEVVTGFSEVGVNAWLEKTLRLTPEMIRVLRVNPNWRDMLWEGMRLAQDVAWLLNDWGQKGQGQDQKESLTNLTLTNVVADETPTVRFTEMQRQVQEAQRRRVMDVTVNPPVIGRGWETRWDEIRQMNVIVPEGQPRPTGQPQPPRRRRRRPE